MISRRRSNCLCKVLVAPLLCLSPLLAYAAGCSDSDREALQWLQRMARSSEEVSYNGVVTLQRQGEDMQVMQVSTAVADSMASERLIQLTGQGAEVRRRAHPLHCVHPGLKLLLEDTGEAGQCGLAEQYRFETTDGSRVAGRRAVRLVVTPRDIYRYGYVLELDRRTGLLLRSETVGRDRRVLEKFQFADLTYDERPASGAEVSLVHRAQHPAPGHSDSTAQLVSEGWAPRWLPRGFTATDNPPDNASRKTFTDGLAVFSVFIEQLDRAIRPGEGLTRSGSTTVYTRGMALGEAPVLVTVIGEVPVNTARMVADSVVPVR